jgi:hypothetical protein
MRITFCGEPTAIAPRDVIVAFRFLPEAKRPPGYDPTHIPAFFRVLRNFQGRELFLTFGIEGLPPIGNDTGRPEGVYIDLPFELAADRFVLTPTRDPALVEMILKKAWSLHLKRTQLDILIPNHAKLIGIWTVA